MARVQVIRMSGISSQRLYYFTIEKEEDYGSRYGVYNHNICMICILFVVLFISLTIKVLYTYTHEDWKVDFQPNIILLSLVIFS